MSNNKTNQKVSITELTGLITAITGLVVAATSFYKEFSKSKIK